jgi:hypothetical protein
MSRSWVMVSCISTGRMDQWDEDGEGEGEGEGVMAGDVVVDKVQEGGEDLYTYVQGCVGK